MKFRALALSFLALTSAFTIARAPVWAAPKAPVVAAPIVNAQNIDVRAMGARGDGRADDTAAFERAILRGRQLKLPVYVPRGQYKITRPLVLREQELVGDGGGWPADSVPLATLVIAQTRGPGVAMEEFSTLRGLAIVYPEDTQFPATKAPAAVELRGQGPTISHLRIQYAYDGISTAPNARPGRARLSDIFMVRPVHEGLYLSGSLDVAQVRNIEVWCNGKMASGAAFRFGRNDDCQASDLFAFNCEIGFDFETDPRAIEDAGGVFFGSLTNCSTDACATGFRVRGDHKFNLTNSNMLNHRASLDVDGAGASVCMANCYLQSNGAPNIVLTRAADFAVNNCTFTRSFAGDFPYVQAANCASLIATSCNFKDLGPGIELGAQVKRAIINNNVFESARPAIYGAGTEAKSRILAPNLWTGADQTNAQAKG